MLANPGGAHGEQQLHPRSGGEFGELADGVLPAVAGLESAVFGEFEFELVGGDLAEQRRRLAQDFRLVIGGVGGFNGIEQQVGGERIEQFVALVFERGRGRGADGDRFGDGVAGFGEFDFRLELLVLLDEFAELPGIRLGEVGQPRKFRRIPRFGDFAQVGRILQILAKLRLPGLAIGVFALHLLPVGQALKPLAQRRFFLRREAGLGEDRLYVLPANLNLGLDAVEFGHSAAVLLRLLPRLPQARLEAFRGGRQ